MIYLYSWYILPNSRKISGDIKKNGVSLFIQENIESIEIIQGDDDSDLYLFNKKYILEKNIYLKKIIWMVFLKNHQNLKFKWIL